MNKIRIYFILLALTAVACNKDELITTDVEQVPIITFDTDPAVYPVKVGREFTITPSYQFVDRAVYRYLFRPSNGSILPDSSRKRLQ